VPQNYDFFNGDADGIISLHQYRMFADTDTELFTGVKRDIKLLRHCLDVKNSRFYVFDISLLSNHDDAVKVLGNENTMIWFDHHEPGELNLGENFTAKIDPDPNCCTNLMVDRYLDGIYRPWTICGAYGDNLHELADTLNPHFTKKSMDRLREVGETLNYNGYGNEESDLTVHPKEVYIDIHKYESPFEYRKKSEVYNKIYEQKTLDEQELERSQIVDESSIGVVILLPDSKASVRYSGIYSNKMTTDNPSKAFAILTRFDEESYRISIRSPKTNPYGASTLAKMFPGGGGREKAAGINQLPKKDLQSFIDKFKEVYDK
jgi:nanoRNase/pAp phosphatase (c-di-AMP/oligoRNAs hydrolase)